MPLNHLAVYLNNRCNLACSYCYVAVNQGPAERLSFEEIRDGIDRFLEAVPAPDRKMTLLGGEPLLDWPFFVRVVEHARRVGGNSLVIQTFTNGTTMDRGKLDFLMESGVLTTISLDGKAETNDRNRLFYNAAAGKSVYDAVLARLEGLPLADLGVSLVFTSETVEKLLENVEHFRAMGFRRITFNPELYEPWPEERLAVLKAVLRGFRRYYRALLEREDPFVLQILFSVLESRERPGDWWHDCHNMVLGPDARFYSCDKALSFPVGEGKASVIGTAAEGLDGERRAEHYREARAYIEGKGWGSEEYFCPMGVYFHSRIAGKDPEHALADFHRVSELFGRELSALVDECEGHPRFKELYAHANVV